jgi:hypothetical protein
MPSFSVEQVFLIALPVIAHSPLTIHLQREEPPHAIVKARAYLKKQREHQAIQWGAEGRKAEQGGKGKTSTNKQK